MITVSLVPPVRALPRVGGLLDVVRWARVGVRAASYGILAWLLRLPFPLETATRPHDCPLPRKSAGQKPRPAATSFVGKAGLYRRAALGQQRRSRRLRALYRFSEHLPARLRELPEVLLGCCAYLVRSLERFRVPRIEVVGQMEAYGMEVTVGAHGDVGDAFRSFERDERCRFCNLLAAVVPGSMR
ncbi:hypothetical protein ACWD4T_00635 [Streptomyces umbrinus]